MCPVNSAFSVRSLSASNNPIIPELTFIIYVHSEVLIVLHFILCDFHEKGCADFPQIRSQTPNSRRHKGDVRQVFILTTHRTKLNRTGGLAPGGLLHPWAWILTLENTTKIWWVHFLLYVRTLLMTLDMKNFMLCLEYVERFATNFVGNTEPTFYTC